MSYPYQPYPPSQPRYSYPSQPPFAPYPTPINYPNFRGPPQPIPRPVPMTSQIPVVSPPNLNLQPMIPVPQPMMQPVIQLIQSPFPTVPAKKKKEKFKFKKRTAKLNWGLIENISTKDIVENSDAEAIKFYSEQFIKSNISDQDEKMFTSKASLNAFAFLQLSLEYFFAKAHEVPTESTEADKALVERYNQEIEIATQTVQDYKQQISVLEKEKESLISKGSQMEQRFKKLYDQSHPKKPQKKKHNQSEPGALSTTALKPSKKTQRNDRTNTLSEIKGYSFADDSYSIEESDHIPTKTIDNFDDYSD